MARFNISYIAMISALFPLGIFILSFKNIKVTQVSSYLDEIRSSLNDYPLSEFEYLSYCGNKYNNYIFTFPGSKNGCTCVHISSYYYDQSSGEYEVNPKECTYNQSRNGCVDIDSFQPRNLSYWGKGMFCSKKYDVSRLTYKGYLHYLNHSVLKDEECEKGYKKCGLLDDMGNYLCLPEEEACPINDIKVTDRRSPELEGKNYNFSYIGGRYFYYTNTSNNPVIVKMKVTEGKICMDRTYKHSDYPQYILDNNFKYYGCKHKIDGKLYQDNLDILDVRKKADLYEDSNLQLYTTQYYGRWYYDFPFFSLEANMNLYSQRYIGYDKKSLMKNGAFELDDSLFNEKKINEINEKITKTISNSKYEIWYSAISFLIILLSSTRIESEDDSPYIWLWSGVNLLLYLLTSVLIYKNLNNIKEFKKFKLSGGKIINLKIDFYNSTQSKLKTATILSVIFINCPILINIIIIILKYFLPNIGRTSYVYNYNFNNINGAILDNNPNEKPKSDNPPEAPYYENNPEQPYYNQNQQINSESGIDNLIPQADYSRY